MTTMLEPTPVAPPEFRAAAWRHKARVLRDHPGQWHTVRDDCPSNVTARSVARDIRDGVLVAFRPAGAYDASPVGRTVRAVYLPDHHQEGTQ